MILESIFMIRGGRFGQNFSFKVLMIIATLIVCFYDWKKNDRLDYFWIFIVGTIIWTCAEIGLQIRGTRILKEKILFRVDVSENLLITIPIQGMSEGATVAIIGVFFGDRLMSEETRDKAIVIFILFLSMFLLFFIRGFNFLNVNVGGDVPSRRDMFPIYAIIFTIVVITPAIIWLLTTDPYSRKRGLYMLMVMLIFASWWTFTEWITGQRWIEIGTVNPDGTFSIQSRATFPIEFLALLYDVVIEISLMYVPFLAIPYLIGAIKPDRELELGEKFGEQKRSINIIDSMKSDREEEIKKKSKVQERDFGLKFWTIFLAFAGIITLLFGIFAISGLAHLIYTESIRGIIDSSFPNNNLTSSILLEQSRFRLYGICALIISGLHFFSMNGLKTLKPYGRKSSIISGILMMPLIIGFFLIWYMNKEKIILIFKR